MPPSSGDRTRLPERSGVASVLAAPLAGPGDRPGPRGPRLGPRHPDRNRLRHPLAGPAEHPRGARTSTSSRTRPASPASSTCRVDAPDLTDPATLRWMAGLQAPGPRAERLHRPQPELPRRRSLPGAGALGLRRRRRRAAAPRATSGRRSPNCPPTTCAGRAGRPATPACPGTRALLSFGIRAQSLEDQQAPDRPGPRRDRRARHARRAAARGRGRARRPAGDRRRGRDRPLGQPLLADPGRADRRRPRPARRLPLAVARALVPLAPGRARQRLVGARALGERHPAQPDVGRPRGADDRDRHRVQRHPQRPLPRGAAAAAARSTRRSAAAYARTGAAVLASGVTATAGFAVLIASDVSMLRDFGVVTVIDLLVALVGVMIALPAALALERGAVRDRYSIAVGLIFAAVIVDRRPQRGRREGAGTLGLDRQPRHWPLPEFAVPLAGRRRWKATPTSPRTTARPRSCPVPPDDRRTPACRVGDAGLDPGLRPLRPALGDLVLVHQGGRLRRTAGRGQPGLRALPWAGGLPLARRARRPRHGSRPGLANAAGRCRSATTATARSAPLPRRRLPDLRLRLPRRHPAERQHRRPHRRPARARGSTAAGGDPRRRRRGG